jgi:hypothetical protein
MTLSHPPAHFSCKTAETRSDAQSPYEHASYRDAICSVEAIAVGDRKSVHNLERIGQPAAALTAPSGP